MVQRRIWLTCLVSVLLSWHSGVHAQQKPPPDQNQFTIEATRSPDDPVDTGIKLRAGQQFVLQPNLQDRWAGGGPDVNREAVPYEHGQELAVTVRFEGEDFECKTDGRIIAKGKRKESGPITLRVSGGDNWSPGAVEYWDFQAVAPQRAASSKSAAPGVVPMEEGWAIL